MGNLKKAFLLVVLSFFSFCTALVGQNKILSVFGKQSIRIRASLKVLLESMTIKISTMGESLPRMMKMVNLKIPLKLLKVELRA